MSSEYSLPEPCIVPSEHLVYCEVFSIFYDRLSLPLSARAVSMDRNIPEVTIAARIHACNAQVAENLR